MLGYSPGFVVAGASMVTGQSPVVLSAMEGLPFSVDLGFGLILGKLYEVVAELLPNDLNPRLTFQSFQWETMLCPLVITLLVVLWFLFRLVKSIGSRLYVRHEKQLLEKLAVKIREKCQLIDKLRVTEKEYAWTESLLENARLEKVYLNITSLIDTYRNLKRTNMMLIDELTSLVQELRKERSKCSKQEEIEEISKMLASLEGVVRLNPSEGDFPDLPGGREPRTKP